jgi:hypothetical protein
MQHDTPLAGVLAIQLLESRPFYFSIPIERLIDLRWEGQYQSTKRGIEESTLVRSEG